MLIIHKKKFHVFNFCCLTEQQGFITITTFANYDNIFNCAYQLSSCLRLWLILGKIGRIINITILLAFQNQVVCRYQCNWLWLPLKYLWQTILVITLWVVCHGTTKKSSNNAQWDKEFIIM